MITYNQLAHRDKSRVTRFKKGTRSKRLGHNPQKRGTCWKVTTMKPKKPNSAIRKIAKVTLSSGLRITGYIPGQGHDLREYSQVLVRGGHVPDLPGVQYHLIRGKFDFGWKESFFRMKAHSKYGVSREDWLRQKQQQKEENNG